MRALFSCNIVVESVKAHDGSSWMQTQCVEHSEHDRCEAHRVASTNCRAASRLRTPRITVAPWTDAHDGSSEGRGEEGECNEEDNALAHKYWTVQLLAFRANA